MSTVEKFNVGGVLLNQPFKIRRLGHFGFNLVDMEWRHPISIGISSAFGFRTSSIIPVVPKVRS